MLTVTQNSWESNEKNKKLVEIMCLSTDTKPDGYMNGSLCLEMDTGDFYYFDGETKTWNKIGG